MYQSERDIILQNYQNARKTYAQYGVDTDLAIKEFRSIPIAIHNWSDDDVSGFEKNGNVPSENTVTGNYPGKARNGDEIRQDLEQEILTTQKIIALGSTGPKSITWESTSMSLISPART